MGVVDAPEDRHRSRRNPARPGEPVGPSGGARGPWHALLHLRFRSLVAPRPRVPLDLRRLPPEGGPVTTYDPNRCSTCGKTFAPDEPRHRESGWDRDDYDCDECYATWPMRAIAAVNAKKESGSSSGGTK